jgi:hypothetical protein
VRIYALFRNGSSSISMALQWCSASAESHSGIASTKYTVALVSAPAAGVENALGRLAAYGPSMYEEAGKWVRSRCGI